MTDEIRLWPVGPNLPGVQLRVHDQLQPMQTTQQLRDLALIANLSHVLNRPLDEHGCSAIANNTCTERRQIAVLATVEELVERAPGKHLSALEAVTEPAISVIPKRHAGTGA